MLCLKKNPVILQDCVFRLSCITKEDSPSFPHWTETKENRAVRREVLVEMRLERCARL